MIGPKILKVLSILGLIVSVLMVLSGLFSVLWAMAFTGMTLSGLLDPANWVGLGLFAMMLTGPGLLVGLLAILGFAAGRRWERSVG